MKKGAFTMENVNQEGWKVNWIPVTKRLPEKPGRYLCTSRWDDDEDFSVGILDYGKIADGARLAGITFGEYGFGEEWPDGIDNIEETIAWAELPEVDPYKEDADEGNA